MTARSEPLIIYLYPGTPETGWCNECLLPSQITFSLVTLDEDGVSQVGTITTCTSHGSS